MRMVHAGRLFALCAVVLALLPAVRVKAAVDAYMTMVGATQGKIKGDAPAGNIHVLSVVRNASSGLPSGRRMHADIVITKEVDQASPKLFMAMNSHETLSEVAISWQGGSGDAKTAQKIVLTNATITNIRKTGNTEQITLQYESIEVTYLKGGKTATDDWEAPV